MNGLYRHESHWCLSRTGWALTTDAALRYCMGSQGSKVITIEKAETIFAVTNLAPSRIVYAQIICRDSSKKVLVN